MLSKNRRVAASFLCRYGFTQLCCLTFDIRMNLIFFIQYCALSNCVDENDLFSMGKNKDEIKHSFLRCQVSK